MRWELYLEQTQGSGVIALAIFALVFGFFSWWYLLLRIPWIKRWSAQVQIIFWILIIMLYLSFIGWLCFAWPEI